MPLSFSGDLRKSLAKIANDLDDGIDLAREFQKEPGYSDVRVGEHTDFPGEPYPEKMTPLEFFGDASAGVTCGWYTKEKHPSSEDLKASRSASV